MAENKTSAQVREQHIRDMGPDLGAVYNALYNDVTSLHARWTLYQQLFAKSAERIELLNEAAGFFFGVLQDALLEDIVLHLARLTDPPKSVGKDNLSLRRLPELTSDPALRIDIDTLVDAALGACAVAREWRNRRLAHRDLALALATGADPLPGISRAHVDAALLAFRTLLNKLELHFWNSTTMYEFVVTGVGDADSLVYYLNRGIRAERARRERLRSGNSLPEDVAREEEV